MRNGYAENTAVDTTFVLFFMALELGRSFNGLSIDSFFFTATLLVVMIAPYLLMPDARTSFSSWVSGRAFVALLAISLGYIYKLSLGVILPDAFRFLPMTLLIISALLCCYIQFYGLLRLRLAR